MFLFRIAAHVCKWQDANRHPLSRGFALLGWSRLRRCRIGAASRLYLAQLLRQIRITRSVCVKVKNVNLASVLHFHLAEIMQIWSPTPVLLKILRHTLREQDMSAVATIHDPLRDIDANSRRIGAIIQVRDCAHRTAVHPHAPAARGTPSPPGSVPARTRPAPPRSLAAVHDFR